MKRRKWDAKAKGTIVLEGLKAFSSSKFWSMRDKQNTLYHGSQS